MNGEHGGPALPEEREEPQEPGRGRTLNRLIVKLNRERYSDAADVEEAARALAAEIPGADVERISGSGRVLLNLAEDADSSTLAAEVSQRDDVEYAEPDVIDHAVDADD